MKCRKLGRTGIDVSVVCLGCMRLIGPDQEEEHSIATIHASLDAGVNFFDTARGYQDGENERLLGRVLAPVRDEVVIATKLNDLDPDAIYVQCEESLQRLQTEYIDLYQIHWPVAGADLGAALQALDDLQQQGKIRAIGVSNFGVSYMQDLLAQPVRVEANQLNYGLIWRPIEQEVQPVCIENDWSILAYSPLNIGLLTGKFQSADELPQERAQPRLFSSSRPGARHTEPGCERELFECLAQIGEIAESVGQPMASVGCAWVLAQEGVASIITGARTPAQASENAGVADLALSSTVLDRLASVSEPIKEYAGLNCDQWSSVSRMEKPA